MPTPYVGLSPDDHQLIDTILRKLHGHPDVGQRLSLITEWWLGFPYLRDPLIGSDTEPEVLVATLQGFDCVTFVETALALAWARDAEDFLGLLCDIRYQNGTIAWLQRLHYATDWLHYHVQRGTLYDLTHGAATQCTTRRLALLPAFPPHTSTLRYFPTSAVPDVSRCVVANGDIILFVSTRQELDVFHIGLLCRVQDDVVLRHASRSRGQVVEQSLAAFVHANTMPGVILARPQQRPHPTPAKDRAV